MAKVTLPTHSVWRGDEIPHEELERAGVECAKVVAHVAEYVRRYEGDKMLVGQRYESNALVAPDAAGGVELTLRISFYPQREVG